MILLIPTLTNFMHWSLSIPPQIFWISDIFFNWDSLQTRLNNYWQAWSYKKKSNKNIKTYRKSVSKPILSVGSFFLKKEPTNKMCLLILDLKPLKSKSKGKHSIDIEFQNLAVKLKKTANKQPWKKMQFIRITSKPPSRMRKWNQFRWTSTKVIPTEKT